jgi:hypothetical protein
LRWELPRELLWAIIFSLAVFVVALWPLHHPYSQAPQVHPQQKSAKGISGGDEAQHTPPGLENPSGTEKKEDGANHAQDAEIWGVKRGEWLLFLATLGLWYATWSLVRDAKETSQRQLRAYLSANPTQIASAEREERFVQITFKLKNHGQTPAREIHHIFGFDVFSNPLPEGFSYPATTTPVHMNATLFPEGDMEVWFNFNRLITTDEFNLLEQDRLRLHIWGETFYRTAFESTHHTDFRASVGGPAFVANLRAMRRKSKGPDFKWTWESGHGDGD